MFTKFTKFFDIKKKMSLSKEVQKVYDLAKKIYDQRDASHDIKHIDRVLNFCNDLLSLEERAWVILLVQSIQVVAILHDLLDHKYKTSVEQEKEIKEIYDLVSELKFKHHELFPKIIARISYSKEKQDRIKHKDELRNVWSLELGVEGMKIRDIVSDADKLDALGESGYQRCFDYISSIEKHSTIKQKQTLLLLHFEDKLLQMNAQDYIVTQYAKSIATKLESEMIGVLIKELNLQSIKDLNTFVDDSTKIPTVVKHVDHWFQNQTKKKEKKEKKEKEEEEEKDKSEIKKENKSCNKFQTGDIRVVNRQPTLYKSKETTEEEKKEKWAKVEQQCRKQGHLLQTDKIQEIIQKDEQVVQQSGITYQQLKDFFKKISFHYFYAVDEKNKCKSVVLTKTQLKQLDDTKIHYNKNSFFELFNGVLTVGMQAYRGFEDCPFTPMGADFCDDDESKGGDRDWFFFNNKTQQCIHMGDLLFHQIVKHHFFQSPGTLYRVDPKKMLEVFDLKPNVDYSTETETKTIWNMTYSTNVFSDEEKIECLKRLNQRKQKTEKINVLEKNNNIEIYSIKEAIVICTPKDLSQQEAIEILKSIDASISIRRYGIYKGITQLQPQHYSVITYQEWKKKVL
jgi:ribosomal protein L12E/L44/L45/RPP1/RPP2